VRKVTFWALGICMVASIGCGKPTPPPEPPPTTEAVVEQAPMEMTDTSAMSMDTMAAASSETQPASQPAQ
jgi:hypothetical protein